MTQNRAIDLLLLTTNLSQLKDQGRITTLFIEGVNAIFPELVFSWTDSRGPGVDDSQIEVCTRKETFGFITYSGKVPLEEDTWALIHNASQMLGVILEKSRQEQLLVEQNKRLEVLAEAHAQMAAKLEQRVAERTAALEEANQALANSRLAALNMMADAVEAGRQAEQTALALRESEEHFRNMAEELTDVLFTTDAQGFVTYISPASSQVFGWPPEEMQGHPFTDFLPETEIPKAMAEFQITVQTGAPTRSLNLLMKRSGDNTFFGELNGSPIWRNGQVTGTLGLIRDITERREAEEKLQDSLNKLEAAQEVAKIGFWNLDLPTSNLEWSSGVKSIFGLAPDDPSPTIDEFWNYVHPEDKVFIEQQFNRQLNQLNKTAISYIYRIVTKAGLTKSLEHIGWQTFAEDGRLIGLYGSVQDVTERRQAEAALRESEEKYRLLANNISDVLWVLDLETGRWTYLSPSVERLRGYTVEEVLTQSIEDVITPDSLAYVQARLPERTQLFLSGAPGPHTYIDEIEQTCKDGSTVWTEVSNRFMKDEHGHLSLLGVSRNIAERKLMEEELANVRITLEAAFEQAPVPMVLVSMPDATLRIVNTACRQLLGVMDEPEATGQRLTDFRPSYKEYDAQGKPAPLNESPLALAMRGQSTLNQERKIITKNGDTHWALVSANPIYNSQGNLIAAYLVFPNITKRKQAEEALRQSYHRQEETMAELRRTQDQLVRQERLAAVGQLAAGIAHDFNNILTGILGFTELMLLSSNTPVKMRPQLQQIIDSGQRAAHLVSQLLDFSRKSIRQPKQLNLSPIIQEMFKFLERILPENIRLELEITPGDYLLEVDPNQLQNLITNLAVNARDAMPIGGKLIIRTARLMMDGRQNCTVCEQPITGDWITLSVTDTGSGIPPEVMPHIFEPFYTTKEVGKGTGLGLSQVYGIVTQYSGHITIDSQPGQGTIITIYLPPVIANKKIGNETEGAFSPPQSGHGETILLVEDDRGVLEVNRALLERLNYQVITAVNGREAIQIYQARQADIALVLSDMMMPDMMGEALFHLLKAYNPALKMVIMSGYLLKEKGAELLQQGITAWIEKPTSFRQISQVVSRALSVPTREANSPRESNAP